MGKPKSSKRKPKNKQHKPTPKTKKPNSRRKNRKPKPPQTQNRNRNPGPPFSTYGGGGGGGGYSSGDDSDSPPASPGSIRRLLEPFTREQLTGFLLDAAAGDRDLVSRIAAAADADVSHRKLFVHGLGPDATRGALLAAFSPLGDVEDCNVVSDRHSGRSKGYGFVLFRFRPAARKALANPHVRVGDRTASVQLASLGPPASAGAGGGGGDIAARRVYVSNVHVDAKPDTLRAFFSQFGEIEAGPFGFDASTGKSRGFALFVYKSVDGAKKALQEPYRMFEGRKLHCQVASDPAHKNKNPPPQQVAADMPLVTALPSAAVPQSVLASVAAAQNLGMFGHGQSPAYAALLGQNPFLATAAWNPAALAAAAALAPATPQVVAASQPLGLGGTGSAAGLLGSYQPSSSTSDATGAPGRAYGGFPGYQ